MISTTQLVSILTSALEEDAPRDDVTTEWIVPEKAEGKAKLIAKESGIFFGEDIIQNLFMITDPNMQVTLYHSDGDPLQKGDVIAEFSGSTHTILKTERVLLNFVQRLSGISTMTRRCIDTLDNPKIRIMETRKTTPTLRFLEKRAVEAGGGTNHRQNLSDMMLIKENHLSQLAKYNQLDTLSERLTNFKKTHPDKKIEIEIESPDQLHQLDLQHADIIMFDNFDIADISKASKQCDALGYKALREVSGNITLETLPLYRDLPIHRISMGCLTHSVKALDLSLLLY